MPISRRHAARLGRETTRGPHRTWWLASYCWPELVASIANRYVSGKRARFPGASGEQEGRNVDERWMPILAGVVGVIGGIGGAFVGGWVANAGQQERFESERVAQLQDFKIETYANFAKELEDSAQLGGDQAEVRAAHASVLLVSSSDALREASEVALAAAVATPDDPTYTEKRDAFVELAQEEVDPD